MAISVEEALKTVLENVPAVGAEEIDARECAGRILAADCAADADVPNADNSAMDGYAVRAEDLKEASPENPVTLTVIGEIPAGRSLERKVRAGEAARIMTGAPIPAGADSVVMVEYTERGEGTARVMRSVKTAENVRFAGEDVAAGATVLMAGKRLTPADAGMLAATGHATVRVAKKPVVGVISTGNEVVSPDTPLKPGLVRNSNSYSLYAMAVEAGAQPVSYGNIPDKKDLLVKTFQEAAKTCDLVISTGGVSVGDFDLVRDIFVESGRALFQKIRMKPGKPTSLALLYGVPFFGLPGNPASCMVAFDLFVRPALNKMMGAAEVGWKTAKAAMEEGLKQKKGRVKFLRGIYRFQDGRLTVRSAGNQGAAILTSMVLANCLIVIPEDSGEIDAGDAVEIILLR